MRDTILALDSSGKAAGVCVLRDGAVAAERTVDAGVTHSQALLPLVREVLREAGLAAADVGLYAVTAGPGSFTGLRIGMALVKGLALPQNTPAVAVSTLEAAALASGLEGTVVAALDARRGEVYWAAFGTAGGLRRLTPDAAGPVEAIGEEVDFAKGPVFFVGDGARLCYNVYKYGTIAKNADAGLLPIARGAAFLAAGGHAGAAAPAAALRPNYLRRPQAEREREAARLAAGTKQ